MVALRARTGPGSRRRRIDKDAVTAEVRKVTGGNLIATQLSEFVAITDRIRDTIRNKSGGMRRKE